MLRQIIPFKFQQLNKMLSIAVKPEKSLIPGYQINFFTAGDQYIHDITGWTIFTPRIIFIVPGEFPGYGIKYVNAVPPIVARPDPPVMFIVRNDRSKAEILPCVWWSVHFFDSRYQI